MDLTLAVLADYANITEDGKLNIMGVFGEINPPTLPFALPMMFLVIGFSASPSEVGAKQEIRIALISEEGRELFNLESSVVASPPKRSDRPAYIQSIIGLGGCKFEREGMYHFAIMVNGEEKRRLPLRVNEPEGEAPYETRQETPH